MQLRLGFHRLAACAGLAVAFQLAYPVSAGAGVLSTTPSLPLLGVPYVPSAGLGCFPTAGLCITNGSFVLTSVVSSSFNPSGQDILTNAVYSGQLTTLGNTPLGPVTLTGTLDQEVMGRTFSTELGSWTADLTGLALTGPVQGHTLSVGLDGTHTSSGITSIAEADTDLYLIDSFFDVFVELSLDRTPPLSATGGPVNFQATPAELPEPKGLLVLVPALLGLIAARWRASASADKDPNG